MKKHKHEDHINHEAWAIPYADLMTLLLAFFVVMYAVSVVNEGKYRVMSQSLMEAFNGSSHVIAPMPKHGATPRNVAPSVAAPPGQAGAALSPIAIPIPLHPSDKRVVNVRARKHEKTASPMAGQTRRDAADQDANTARQRENLARIRDQVKQALQPLIDKNQVIVRSDPNWLEVEIRTDILFASGVAQLSVPADQVLSRLAGILAPFSNPLRVEGYTDDVPINTAVYPSNWELSAARAASVARLFSEHGVSPHRMGIIGWGQFRPAADNATAQGRNRNRRVLVVVLSDKATPTRYSSDAGDGSMAEPPRVARVEAPARLPASAGTPPARAIAAGRSLAADPLADGPDTGSGQAGAGDAAPLIVEPMVVTPAGAPPP